MDPATKPLFDRILTSKDAFFKHQKVEDEELTEAERTEIVQECFEKKKAVFLQRYEKFIKEGDSALFSSLTDPTSIFLLNRIKNRGVDKRNVRNRRYMAMEALKREGKYFADEQMREREPYLYDVMVGRFLDDSERKNIRPSVARKEGAWSGMIEQFESSQEISERRKMHKTQFEGVKDENPAKARLSRLLAHVSNKDDSEDEYDLDDIRDELEQISKEDAEQLELGLDGTKEQLREEFESFMMERFLAGKDSRFFDYDGVDSDDRMEATDAIKERDEEERWFDED